MFDVCANVLTLKLPCLHIVSQASTHSRVSTHVPNLKGSIRQDTRAKSKSGAVVKHQRMFVVSKTTSNTKWLFKSGAAPLYHSLVTSLSVDMYMQQLPYKCTCTQILSRVSAHAGRNTVQLEIFARNNVFSCTKFNDCIEDGYLGHSGENELHELFLQYKGSWSWQFSAICNMVAIYV